jgi:hypothetical protein
VRKVETRDHIDPEHIRLRDRREHSDHTAQAEACTRE